MIRPLVTGSWRLSDLEPPEANAPTVFSCFHCGGGSTMGYKLAGFNVLGGVEIDPRMMNLYRTNLKPSAFYSFMEPIQDFKKRDHEGWIHEDMMNLDILDGSPPCSSFSMAGNREKDWGKNKVFREGQASQVLDDLFFHFIDVAHKLRPKIVIAENVKGLTLGHAKGYVKEIFTRFREAGYIPQLFLLNASRMGVPQARERVFFLARRDDLNLSPIRLEFNEPIIPLKKALLGCETSDAQALPPSLERDWYRIKMTGKGKYTSTAIANPERASPTITTRASDSQGSVMAWDRPRKFSRQEIIRICSFPEDYDFLHEWPSYPCGMSVPPLMMQRVAAEVLRQWILPLRA